MSTEMSAQGEVGVESPYASVEVLPGHKVDWQIVANHKQFKQAALNSLYEKLFDPKHGSPLHPGRRFDTKKKAFVSDSKYSEFTNGLNRVARLNVPPS
jgi:hypothetical protein